MNIRGLNRGLSHEYQEPLQYYIQLNDERYPLNNHIGKKAQLSFDNKIQCVHCGRVIKKTFNNGSCYPCFRDLAENDLCIVKPSLCHFEKGTCRDHNFAETHCMTPHYVYLAVSSDIKVGLTREGNTLKRWGDQGAVQAVPIAKLPTRKQAGDLELFLSEHFPDKTNWRKMLKGEAPDLRLEELRAQAFSYMKDEHKVHMVYEAEPIRFSYPIEQPAAKITAYNLDKEPAIDDRLVGIKGQYLIFECGVLNMKKYAGYHLQISLT